jgi:hypothetical protein
MNKELTDRGSAKNRCSPPQAADRRRRAENPPVGMSCRHRKASALDHSEPQTQQHSPIDLGLACVEFPFFLFGRKAKNFDANARKLYRPLWPMTLPHLPRPEPARPAVSLARRSASNQGLNTECSLRCNLLRPSGVGCCACFSVLRVENPAWFGTASGLTPSAVEADSPRVMAGPTLARVLARPTMTRVVGIRLYRSNSSAPGLTRCARAYGRPATRSEMSASGRTGAGPDGQYPRRPVSYPPPKRLTGRGGFNGVWN